MPWAALVSFIYGCPVPNNVLHISVILFHYIILFMMHHIIYIHIIRFLACAMGSHCVVVGGFWTPSGGCDGMFGSESQQLLMRRNPLKLLCHDAIGCSLLQGCKC